MVQEVIGGKRPKLNQYRPESLPLMGETQGTVSLSHSAIVGGGVCKEDKNLNHIFMSVWLYS
jgi:hypothetical protein